MVINLRARHTLRFKFLFPYPDIQGMFSAGFVFCLFLTWPTRGLKCRAIAVEQLFINLFQRISPSLSTLCLLLWLQTNLRKKYHNATLTVNERFTRTPSAGDTK